MRAVQSFHASIKQTIAQNGITQEATQELDQDLANHAYGRLTGPGPVSFEIAMDLPAVFVRLAGRPWQTPEEAFGFSFEDLGFSLDSVGVGVDVVSAAETVERLEDSVVDGETLFQIRSSGSAANYFKLFAAQVGGSGPVPDLARSVRGGTVTATYLIDQEFRMRAVSMSMKYSLQGVTVETHAEVHYSNFGAPVKLPPDLPRH
jgi:hypothetical protein